jgi:RNA polymerase sigma-70 factor (ECF subfamily)
MEERRLEPPESSLTMWPTPISSLFAISDEQAMWRVQTQDDEAAFARLVERWQLPIQRLCIRMTGDTHLAQDLAQEAFVRVYCRRKDYRPEARFSTYLWRIAMNLCYDQLRKAGRRPEIALNDGEEDGAIDMPSNEPDPVERLDHSERAETVKRALLRLPEHYRSVLVLRHYESLKFREIADVLEIPEGTVKSRMSEGLDLLARMLNGKAKEPPSGMKPQARKFEPMLL